MSDLILNLDTTIHQCTKKGSETNKKHQRFVKRRRFLERKGFLKQKQLPAQPSMPKRDALHRREGMDWERNKKRQKIDRQDGHIGWDRPGRDCNPLQEEGLTRRPKVFPKENSSHSAKESGNPSGLSSAPSKIGSSFVRHNRAQANSSVGNIRTASLFSEYDSGLPMLAALNLPSRMVAMDCEMVGTGPGGRNSDLARCSIVSYYGDVIYDKYIRPVNPITNYRTRWSGIRRHHMTNAVPFREAQKEILKIFSGKIVVGHAIHNDFKALKYFHPKSMTRDTSKIPPLNRKAGFPENEAASLKRLTKQLLHRDIQVGHNGHSSVEDAQATMELYKVIEAEWEMHLAVSPAQE